MLDALTNQVRKTTCENKQILAGTIIVVYIQFRLTPVEATRAKEHVGNYIVWSYG
eukprot:COSAG05_NODE_442_length_9803_cov_28.091921_11_plen_55_part_00